MPSTPVGSEWELTSQPAATSMTASKHVTFFPLPQHSKLSSDRTESPRLAFASHLRSHVARLVSMRQLLIENPIASGGAWLTLPRALVSSAHEARYLVRSREDVRHISVEGPRHGKQDGDSETLAAHLCGEGGLWHAGFIRQPAPRPRPQGAIHRTENMLVDRANLFVLHATPLAPARPSVLLRTIWVGNRDAATLVRDRKFKHPHGARAKVGRGSRSGRGGLGRGWRGRSRWGRGATAGLAVSGGEDERTGHRDAWLGVG